MLKFKLKYVKLVIIVKILGNLLYTLCHCRPWLAYIFKSAMNTTFTNTVPTYEVARSEDFYIFCLIVIM